MSNGSHTRLTSRAQILRAGLGLVLLAAQPTWPIHHGKLKLAASVGPMNAAAVGALHGPKLALASTFAPATATSTVRPLTTACAPSTVEGVDLCLVDAPLVAPFILGLLPIAFNEGYPPRWNSIG